jgi:8-oxo-dGTP diphosphatase
MNHIGDVVCAIIEQDGRFLIAQRPKGKSLSMKWEFPGGKVQEGESHTVALSRELHEELLIEVAIIQPLTPVNHAYGDFSLRLVPFRCRITAGTPVATEHERLEWIGIDEACLYDFPEADIPVLEEYRTVFTQR